MTNSNSKSQDISNDIIELWSELEEYPGYKISNFGKLMTPKGYLSRASQANLGR